MFNGLRKSKTDRDVCSGGRNFGIITTDMILKWMYSFCCFVIVEVFAISGYTEIIEAESNDTLGVLGQDYMISDLNPDMEGEYFRLIGTFWAKRADGTYLFSYKENGSQYAVDIVVTDETEESVLSLLDGLSYESEISVEMLCIYDKAVEVSDNKMFYYMTAVEAEILESGLSEQEDNNFHIGDCIHLSNGVDITITDGGICSDEYDTFVYIEVDIYNDSGADFYISSGDVKFYKDDYLLSASIPFNDNSNPIISSNIPDGRKVYGRFYAECSNYDETSSIEAEFFDNKDIVVTVKNDEGQSQIGVGQTSSGFGGEYIDGTDDDSDYLIMTQEGDKVSYQWYMGSELLCSEDNLSIVNEVVEGTHYLFWFVSEGELVAYPNTGERADAIMFWKLK